MVVAGAVVEAENRLAALGDADGKAHHQDIHFGDDPHAGQGGSPLP